MKFEALRESLEALSHWNKTLHAAICDEQGEYFIPGPRDLDDRQRIADALCQMWIEDSLKEGLPRSGLLCVAPATIEIAHRLNDAKAAFAAAIEALRENKPRGTRMSAYLARQLTEDNQRNKDVAQALNRLGFASLKLQLCTRKVGVLPGGLRSVRWTWDRKNYEITSLTRQEVVTRISALSGQKAQDMAMMQLNAIPAGEPLAFRSRTPTRNKLRANITVLEDSDYTGPMAPYAASVLLTPDKALPKIIKWPDDPEPTEEEERQARSDRRLQTEPAIPILSIYRYQRRSA